MDRETNLQQMNRESGKERERERERKKRERGRGEREKDRIANKYKQLGLINRRKKFNIQIDKKS